VKNSSLKRITNFYESRFKLHGVNPMSLGWGDKLSQIKRFEILCQFLNLNEKSILDVGCGFGDLYPFLRNNISDNFSYYGIDIYNRFIEIAKEKFPEGNFICSDFLKYSFDKKFDVVFLSGALNIKVDDDENIHERFIYSTIEWMYKISSLGIAFNLTSSYTEDKYRNQDTYYSKPEEMFSFCKTICKNVVLRHDYMPNDFTCYLYKNKEK